MLEHIQEVRRKYHRSSAQRVDFNGANMGRGFLKNRQSSSLQMACPFKVPSPTLRVQEAWPTQEVPTSDVDEEILPMARNSPVLNKTLVVTLGVSPAH